MKTNRKFKAPVNTTLYTAIQTAINSGLFFEVSKKTVVKVDVNKIMVVCECCGKKTTKPAYYRWHNGKCAK